MTGFDLSTATDIRYGSSECEVYYGSTKIWPTTIDYKSIPLTLTVLEDGFIGWRNNNNDYNKTIKISINGSSWVSVSPSPATFSVTTGTVIKVKGDNSNYAYYDPYSASTWSYNYFFSDCKIDISGNIMSLINSTGYKNLTSFSLSYAFAYLFQGCNVVNAENLVLPATTLKDYCYYSLFKDCIYLTAPPTLPATTLAVYCYGYMFAGCTNLTTAPELPATTLVNGCYVRMFSGCTSLNYVKCLASSGMTSSSCLVYWLDNVASNGTFIKSPNATTGSSAGASQWRLNNASGIPTNWTVRDAGGSLADPEISWGSATYNYGLGSSSQPVFNNPHSVSVTFTSSDSTIASINSSGVVTYLKRGTVTLTASFSGDSTYYSSTVTCSLTLTGYSSNIGWSSASYSYPLDSQTKPVFSNPNNLTVTFNSSDTSVATINSSGVVTYVAVGTTTLTATFNGNDTYEPSTVTCTLAVTAATSNFLTFDITSSGNIGWKASSGSNTRTLQYRKNGGSWTNITSTTSGATISVANGDKIEFKADNTSIGASGYYNYFTGTANFKIKGYLTSILDADNYAEYDTYGADNIFRYLFYNCTTLTDASGLILPASTRNGCYSRMFQGCTSLVKAPDLPATSIATYAYYHLFDGCSSLNYVKCLATSGINTSSSTTSWMNNVASSGTFVKASGATWPSSTSGIPSSWTVVGM